MENTKAKKIVIGVLIILLLVCLGAIGWQYVKLNSNVNNQGEETGKNNTNNVVNNNQEQSSSEEVNDAVNENKTETDIFDPYQNYKDVVWAGKSDTFTHVKVGAVQEASIEGGFLKIKETYHLQTYYKEIDISGYDIKSVCYEPYNGSAGTTVYLLSNNGSVKRMRMKYLFEDNNNDDNLFKVNEFEALKGKKIIEMTNTTIGLYNDKMYFLTEDGNLITEALHSYEDLNKDYIANIGRWLTINIDPDNKIYLADNKNEISYPINDESGNTIIAKTIIRNYNSGDEAHIIITSKDELYLINRETEKAQRVSSQKVKDYDVQPFEDYTNKVTFTMKDGSTIIYTGILDEYYNGYTQRIEALR